MEGYGTLIREARERAGWTQAEVAERIGVSTSTLSYWENEIRPPEIGYINTIVLALSLSPEELLQAMGVRMTPSMASRLPRGLVLDLLAVPPEVHAAVQLLLDGWLVGQPHHTATEEEANASHRGTAAAPRSRREGHRRT